MGAEPLTAPGPFAPLIVALLAFAAGAALRHVKRFPETAASGLHAFVIWVALPALILARVPHLAVDADVWALVALPWALLVISAGLVLIVARLAKWSREVRGALLLIVPLANTSFLGLPLVEAHLGREAVAPAIVWDQLGSFLALATYGAFVVAAHRAGASTPTARSIALTVVRFPPFIALMLALVLLATGTHPLADAVFGALGQSLVPVVMVAVGLQWRATLPREALAPAGFALVARLVVIPAIAFALSLGLAPLVHATATLEAGMGPMITAGALAIEAGLAPTMSAAILGWGTLLSLVTTAVWAALL